MASVDQPPMPSAVKVPSPILVELDVPVAICDAKDVYAYDQAPYEETSVEENQSSDSEMRPHQDYSSRNPPSQNKMKPQQHYSSRKPPSQNEMQPLQEYSNHHLPTQQLQPDYSNRYPPIQYEMQPQQNVPMVTPYGVQPRQDYSQLYSSYMVWSVLVCCCCAWPCGLLAICFSSEAMSAAKRGDLQDAQNSALKARICISLSVIIGVVGIVCVIVYYQTNGYSIH